MAGRWKKESHKCIQTYLFCKDQTYKKENTLELFSGKPKAKKGAGNVIKSFLMDSIEAFNSHDTNEMQLREKNVALKKSQSEQGETENFPCKFPHKLKRKNTL